MVWLVVADVPTPWKRCRWVVGPVLLVKGALGSDRVVVDVVVA